jgi:hypothetical protein
LHKSEDKDFEAFSDRHGRELTAVSDHGNPPGEPSSIFLLRGGGNREAVHLHHLAANLKIRKIRDHNVRKNSMCW